MTQNTNKEEKITKTIFFRKKKIINKKFGIRINYAHLVDNFKSFSNKSGLRKVCCGVTASLCLRLLLLEGDPRVSSIVVSLHQPEIDYAQVGDLFYLSKFFVTVFV